MRCGRLDMMLVYATNMQVIPDLVLCCWLHFAEPGLYIDSIETDLPRERWVMSV